MAKETANFRAIESIENQFPLGQKEFWPKDLSGNFHGNGNSIRKSHGREGKPLKFMLSVYSTENLKSNVFECADCIYRFTHRQRHLDKFPNHEIKK